MESTYGLKITPARLSRDGKLNHSTPLMPELRTLRSWSKFVTQLPMGHPCATLGLQVHDRVAGKFLSFAGVGKKAMNVVSARGGKFVLDAPDFLKHQVLAAPPT